jgi:hypothetical protein
VRIFAAIGEQDDADPPRRDRRGREVPSHDCAW